MLLLVIAMILIQLFIVELLSYVMDRIIIVTLSYQLVKWIMIVIAMWSVVLMLDDGMVEVLFIAVIAMMLAERFILALPIFVMG